MSNLPYPAPQVNLPRDGGETLSLAELRPSNVVLFFYPKDNTPGCTKEAIGFCEQFDVWKEKSMYGKTYMGIERSTFLIDGSGQVVREWRKVKVPGHVEEVLDAVKSL